jgi:hypothetical protein
MMAAGCDGGREPRPDATAPPTPVADVAYAEAAVVTPDVSLREAGLTELPLPGADVISWPRFQFTVRAAAVTPALTSEQRRRLSVPPGSPGDDPDAPLLAGTGREFLVAVVGAPDDEALGGRPARDISAAVQPDGQPARELTGVSPPLLSVVVVGVPVGGDAVLSLVDDGQSRAMSLRTGRRTAGQILVADTLASDRVTIEDHIRVPGVSLPGTGETVRCRIAVDPTSYRDSGRPARPGSMWLRVDVAVTLNTTADFLVARNATVSVDLGRSLTIRRPDGRRIPFPDGAVTAVPDRSGSEVHASVTAYLEVPDTIRGIDVRFSLHARFTAKDGRRALRYTRIERGENSARLRLSRPDR